MIIEDARGSQPESLLADLNRMRSASVQFNAFVKSLIQDSSSDRQKDETLEAFHRRLRHDLRTPLNAIKGYSELLHRGHGGGSASIRCGSTSPSSKTPPTNSSARSTPWPRWRDGKQRNRPTAAARAQQLDLVADVLRTVQPLPAGGAARGGAFEPYPHRRRQCVQSRRARTPAGARGPSGRDRGERRGRAGAGGRGRSSISSCSISSCRK